MDWINCNMCYRQPSDEKERLFMISSCGHIICDLCLSQAESRDKCIICSEECQLIQISSKMKPEAAMFFQEPYDLLKKQHSQIKRLLDFQKNHRTRLISFHRKILLRCKEMEKQNKLAAERIKLLEKENLKLKELLNSGAGGRGDYGMIGSNSSNPHESYQRVITASAMRNSPQGLQSYQSPAGSRLLERLSLMKGKSGSPATRISPNIQQVGRQPLQQMVVKGSGFPYAPQASLNDAVTPMFTSPDTPRISPYSRNGAKGGRYYIREESPLIQQGGSQQSLEFPQNRKLTPHQIQENYNYKSRSSPKQMFLSQDFSNVPRNFGANMKSYPRYQ